MSNKSNTPCEVAEFFKQPDGPCFMCKNGDNPDFDGECWMHTINGESRHCGGCKQK